ncbi:glycosyltransferase [Candidatus Saccharibacteria bacterium]|nr:glycosyltransferase [Candidatus Saccharibacteria bacterium]
MSKKSLTVIIPYKNQQLITICAVDSLLGGLGSAWQLEVLLVNNRSSPGEVDAIAKKYRDDKRVSLLDYDKRFNFQKINNWAAKQASHDIILFLNNDTELVEGSEGLIERMYSKSRLAGVGAVGCVLLYGDEKHIQHGGVYLSNGGMAEHLYAKNSLRSLLRNNEEHRLKEDAPRTAVTAACLMIEKTKFLAVEGFNEDFVIGGGDVDLCIRLNRAGYQTWCLGVGSSAVDYILHKESITRVGIKLPWSDYVQSYRSYIRGLDDKLVDPYILSSEIEEN